MKFLTTVLLGLLLSTFCQAQETILEQEYKKGAGKIKVTSLFSSLPTRGYLPVRVEIQNNTTSDRVWNLSFDSTDGANNWGYSSGSEENKLQSAYGLNCAAGESKSYDLLVPIVTMFSNTYGGDNNLNLALEVTGSGLGDLDGYMGWEYFKDWSSVLMSADLAHKNSNDLDSHIVARFSGSSHSGRSGGSLDFAGEFQPSNMAGDWRGYVGYDVIVLTEKDWLSTSPAARNAVLEWNRLGGHLIVYSEDPEIDLKQLGINVTTASKGERRSFGRVDLMPLKKGFKIDPKSLTKLIESKRPQDTFPVQIADHYASADWGLYRLLKGAGFQPALLVVVILVFGILVGPINLFVFAKAGKRHRMFITTPLIAISASLVLIAVIIIQDGFGGSGERVQLVEVRADDGEYKAYIKQQQFCRTGVMMSGDFETSTHACISPLPLGRSRLSRVTLENSGGGGEYRISQGETGTLAEGDWFQSRSKLGHYLEAVMPTRGRITLEGDTSNPVLHSGFDFPIATLLYQDADGRWWSSEASVQQGAKVPAKQITEKEAKIALRAGTELFTKELRNLTVDKLMQRKGHFFAITTEAPAIDTHSSIDWERTHSVFTGPVVN